AGPSPEASVAAANAHFAEKKFAEAIVEYRRALQKAPQMGEARYKLAQAYMETRQPALAFREYIYAADLLPDNTEAQLKAADFLLSAGQFEDAKARAASVLARDPNNVHAQIIKGNAT